MVVKSKKGRFGAFPHRAAWEGGVRKLAVVVCMFSNFKEEWTAVRDLGEGCASESAFTPSDSTPSSPFTHLLSFFTILSQPLESA